MSLETNIRDLYAAAHKEMCQFLRGSGVITYSHRGGGAVTLTANFGPDSKQLAEELGCDVEDTAKTFYIPRQTNFPPTNGVSISDEIVWNSKTWDVVRYTVDSVGAHFVIDCVYTQARRIR